MQNFRPLIYATQQPESGEALAETGRRARAAGFDHLLQDGNRFPAEEDLQTIARFGLLPLIHLSLDKPPADATLWAVHPEWRQAPGINDDLPDPRRPAAGATGPVLRLGDPGHEQAIRQWWGEQIALLCQQGVAGFCISLDGPATADFFSLLIATAKASFPRCRFIAWTPGASASRVDEIASCGFDAACTSSAWWDFNAGWLAQELERLRPFPASIAIVRPESSDALLLFGAVTADGLMVTGDRPDTQESAWKAALSLRRESPVALQWETLSPAWDAVTVLRLFGKPAGEQSALLLMVNTSPVAQKIPAASIASCDGLSMGRRLWPLAGVGGTDVSAMIGPGSAALHVAEPGQAIVSNVKTSRRAVEAAVRLPRIAIERISPCVDQGRFAARRTVGASLSVEADIFGEGHDVLAARLQWRAADDDGWTESHMEPIGNDRWAGSFALTRLGRYQFQVEAWIDIFGAWRDEVFKKNAAGQDTKLELREGRQLLKEALSRAVAQERLQLTRGLRRALKALDATTTFQDAIDLMLSGETLALMRQADPRCFKVCSAPILQVDSERRAAGFSSWYELFPRSLGKDASTHGTFTDVLQRLPAIKAMGFDTLYFPPVHPIGSKHRKGKNNALTATSAEPGSPYAIGSIEGGHDAIHPELGTLEDFRALVFAANEQGLEIAMDFAIQCSPDHPWLKNHPEWFSWRPDGSIRYAENPPKKYQDIVNVDFYGAGALPGLWLALRDIVLFWVEQGIHVFRVDNPHTKPMPFWEWLIGDIRSRHPAVIFLAEAFTRPKPMHRLAKLGFSQSYTYFTWRHGKDEFIDYLTHLTQDEPREFFRPHFFVNTPDINPYFLQRSGRAGFVIRAALAATLSGLWGMYSGFELCEAEPVPGKEEYLNSEKYELRQRDWNQPGNIVREITLLNRIRRENPALQSHLGLKFCPSTGQDLICFIKTSAGQGTVHANVVFVAICLDPHATHECDVELPFEDWALNEDAAVGAEDLVNHNRFQLHGKRHHIRLEPDRLPFLIWRLMPKGVV